MEENKPMKTLQEVFDACYKVKWANTASERTVITNGNYLLSCLGSNRPISRISTDDIDKLIAKMESDGNAAATINRKLSLLSTLFTFGQRRGLVESIPYFDRKKVSEGRMYVISREEEQRILQHFNDNEESELRDLCIVACDTGLRMGELLKLEPVLILDSHLYVSADIAKTGKARKIPYTKRAKEVLFRLKDTGLFQDLEYSKLNYKWNQMKEALGITDTDAVFHSWRHTFCSRLAEAGVSPWKIKELAGHSNLKQTEKYTHIQDNGLQEAIEVLEV
jgi:integrase